MQDPGHGPFDLVTVTDAPRRAHALRSSVLWPLRLRLLQPPEEERPWQFGFFDAERYLLQLGPDGEVKPLHHCVSDSDQCVQHATKGPT